MMYHVGLRYESMSHKNVPIGQCRPVLVGPNLFTVAFRNELPRKLQ